MKILLDALLVIVGLILFGFIAAFIYGLIVMLLWNWLVPAIIPKLPIAQQITYWQGWGIGFLIILMFKKQNNK